MEIIKDTLALSAYDLLKPQRFFLNIPVQPKICILSQIQVYEKIHFWVSDVIVGCAHCYLPRNAHRFFNSGFS